MYRFIKGFEYKYMVNDDGKILKLCNCKKPFFLIPQKTERGYLRVNIREKGKVYHIRVHRAVAEAFIPNPENKPEVNHKNGNKQDNRVKNLEWVTSKENMQHAIKKGLFNKKNKPIALLCKGEIIEKFDSITQARKKYGCLYGSITYCLYSHKQSRFCSDYWWVYL